MSMSCITAELSVGWVRPGTLDGAAITLDVTAIRAVYAGNLTADRNAIEGEWRQSGMTLPLTVARVEE